MNKRICFGTLAVLSLFLFSSLTAVSNAYWPPLYEEKDMPELLTRTCPLNITVIFIGFDPQCINTSYLTWLLPKSKPELVLASGDNWGVNYSLNCHYTFTNQSFRTNLENYLATIAKIDPTTIAPPHPYFPLPSTPPLPNIFYNATSVEAYLYSKLSAIGAIPTNGYSAVVMNLSRPWQVLSFPPLQPTCKQPHYYNVTYKDKDNGITWPWGKWMLGWGGHYRFWFIDVSSGSWPGGNLAPYTNYAFNPIWWLNQTYPELGGFRTQRGINFLTEYVRDFVNSMVYNLFAPDLEFPARVSSNYEIAIYAFDNCTGKLNRTVPLIDTNFILSAFSSLVPYSAWRVNITYVHLNGTSDPPLYRGLWSALRSAETTSTGQYVDFEILWSYLEANRASFAPSRADWLTIPVFVFQFKSGFQLAFESKGSAASLIVWGASVYDMTIIGRSELYPPATNIFYGVTRILIHETAHCMGLTHPLQNDWLQDFTATAMSYYTYEYGFSRFEKDLLPRAHVDYYMIRAASLVSATKSLLVSKQTNASVSNYLNLAESNYDQAQQFYDTMNYGSGVPLAQASYTNALIAYQMAQQLPSIAASAAAIYQTIAIGLLGLTGILVLTIYFMHKKAKRSK